MAEARGSSSKGSPRETKQAKEGHKPAYGELVAHERVARAPWCGGAGNVQPGQAPAEAKAAPPEVDVSPVQGVINRFVPPEVFYVEQPFGETFALRRERGHPAGPLPADPSQFPSELGQPQEICHVLAPPAAVRCMAGGFYF